MIFYLINEILKNKWDGTDNQEISFSFEDLQNYLKETLVLKSKINYENFLDIIKESQDAINDMKKDKENTLKKIPYLIKEYSRILYNHLKNERYELIGYFNDLDSSVTKFTVSAFIKFYETHQDLEDHQFVFEYFKNFCLSRQMDINKYRNYRGKERALLFQTENEVIAYFSKSDIFEPTSVFNQFKLTYNLLNILTDLGLIFNNELTEDGKKLLEEYND